MTDYTSIYTPTTTDKVRTAYEGVYKPRFSGSEMAGPMFDRWLAQVKAAAFDEGVAAQYAAIEPDGWVRDPVNPYRTEES